MATLLAMAAGCSKKSGSGFSFAEQSTASSDILTDVEIIDYTPKTNPVVVTNFGVTTFAVQVGSGAGNALVYTFELDGAEVQAGANGFYDLSAASVAAGSHVLEVTVTNGQTSDVHLFNLQKNTPPTVGVTTPAAAGNTVSCGGGALDFQINATDSDSDSLAFSWKFNGASAPSVFSQITSTQVQSTARFAPSCSISGANVITVDVTDGFDVTSYTWSVSVSNPIIAEITGFTPTGNPIIIPSSGSQIFSLSAVGKAPIVYSWRLDGTLIGGAGSSILTLSAGSVSVGPHTLIARVEDSDSFDERTFNIIRNAPPVIANPSPAASSLKMNYAVPQVFTVDASDLNGDSLTYTWTLDGAISGAINDSPTGGGSQAIFSPTTAMVGSHILRVSVTDGTETASQQWTVEVNYFSNSCNNLSSGQICTVVGKVGLGSGEFPLVAPQKVNIHPTQMARDDGSGVFISDQQNHLVWYLNLSSATVTRLGVSIEAGQIKAVVGNGANGQTTNNSLNNQYKLNRPEGLAWDPVTSSLFIAEFDGHVISRVTSSGAGSRVACTGSGVDTVVANGQPALSFHCRNVAALAIDPVTRTLFASLYANNSGTNSHIRAFDISDASTANWTGSTYITSGAGTNGTIGGTARVDRVFAMDMDSRGVIYALDGNSNCRLRVFNRTGSSISFFNNTVSVPAGQTASLTGGTCGSATGTAAATRLNTVSRGVQVVESSPGVIDGWFLSDTGGHRVLYLNNTTNPITIGGTAIPALQSGNITGTTANYNGNLLGNLTLVNAPNGLAYLAGSNRLVISDYSNSRTRSLDLSVEQGNMSNLAGEDFKYGNSGIAATAPNSVIMNSPGNVEVDTVGNALYISDTTNGMVRKLDLLTGQVTTPIGRGRNNALAGSALENPEDVYFGDNGPRALESLGNGRLLVVDRNSGTGTNRSCVARLINTSGSAFSFMQVTAATGKATTVLGSWANGCVEHTNGGAALNTGLGQAEGAVYDGTYLYVSQETDNCIVKVSNTSPTATVETFLGNCSAAAGYQDGTLTDPAVRLRNPTRLTLDPTYAADGNFFFIDAYNQATSYLRYVNQRATSVTISGITIPAQSVGTLVTAGSNYRLTDVAAFDTQYCFARGVTTVGPHNVICRMRTDDLGNTTLRVGSSDSSLVTSGATLGPEQEGVSASNATLYEPNGLTFDAEGNLYISERLNHQIRKVKRWW